jgi:hypothetical protein
MNYRMQSFASILCSDEGAAGQAAPIGAVDDESPSKEVILTSNDTSDKSSSASRICAVVTFQQPGINGDFIWVVEMSKLNLAVFTSGTSVNVGSASVRNLTLCTTRIQQKALHVLLEARGIALVTDTVKHVCLKLLKYFHNAIDITRCTWDWSRFCLQNDR